MGLLRSGRRNQAQDGLQLDFSPDGHLLASASRDSEWGDFMLSRSTHRLAVPI